MDSSPTLASLWDFLNSHAAVTGPASGLLAVLLDRHFLRRKRDAEADSAIADGSEKLARAVVTSIDIYKELAADTKTDAAGKIRLLKRENRDLKLEVADWRNKYELLVAISKIPGLTPGLMKSDK